MLKNNLAFALALLTIGLFTACGEEEKQGPPPDAQFNLEVTARDTSDNPVARVPVLVDQKVVGYTDQDGVYKASLTDKPGNELTLAVGELEGYRWLTEPVTISETLRLNSAGIGIPISLNVQGESRKKEYLVWARIQCDDTLDNKICEGRPVKMNGTEVARTDEFGHAHFTLTEVPQQKLKITIDTPDSNPLTDDVVVHPEDPTYEVALGLESQIFLVEEEFTNARVEEAPKKKKRRKYKRKRTSRKKQKARTSKKTRKSDEVIDLW